MSDELLIAVFVDYENLAIGAREHRGGELNMNLIFKRLLEKGRIVYKRAYCDWSQYRPAVVDLHKHGIELVDIPRTGMSGKNSADIHMVVDAIDLCYSKSHIDTFALLSGDSDFSPLVSKLKENDRRVLGCGVRSSTSDLLIASCDEFIYYDDLVREVPRTPPRAAPDKPVPKKKQEALDRLVEIADSLQVDYDPLWGSLIKQTIRRVYPGFNESYYGYRSFADLLKDAESMGLLELEWDESRRNFQVSLP